MSLFNNNGSSQDSVFKVAFQTACAAVAMVAGVNPGVALLPASHVYDTAKAKLSQ